MQARLLAPLLLGLAGDFDSADVRASAARLFAVRGPLKRQVHLFSVALFRYARLASAHLLPSVGSAAVTGGTSESAWLNVGLPGQVSMGQKACLWVAQARSRC